MTLKSKIETIDVKHVKDVIEIERRWIEGGSVPHCGNWYTEGKLIRVYESKGKIFRVDAKGLLLSSEFKDDTTIHKYIKK